MATYCTDADLVKWRPNILQLGVEDWKEQREEAYAIINRVIEIRWYRQVAEEMGYDWRLTAFTPASVRTGTLTRLECFKTLELAYMHLKKGTPEADGFERLEEQFRLRYSEELDLVLADGIDYDWSGNDTFDDDEIAIFATRRQKRA
jgi:hypothetical protein